MAKKKKKNFKGLTGIKFNDLILPLVLGGVGSYSQPAARGVNLGLQAFRTLQSGREYQAERDAGAESEEGLTAYADSLRTQADTLQNRVQLQGEDTTLNNPLTFMREQAAGRDPAETVQIDPSAFGGAPPTEEESKQTVFDALGLGEGQTFGLDQAPEEQVAQQQLVTDFAGENQEEYAGALVGAKKLREEQLRDLGILQDRATFYDHMASLSKVNPSSAGYLVGQEMLGRQRHGQSLDQIAATGMMYSANNKEKAMYEALLNQAKHGEVMAEIRLRAMLEPKFTTFQGPFGLMNVWKRGPMEGKATDVDGKEIPAQQIQAAVNNSQDPNTRKEWSQGYFSSWQDYMQIKKMVSDGQAGEEEMNSAKAIWMMYWNGMPPWMKEEMGNMYEAGQSPVPPPGYQGGEPGKVDEVQQALQDMSTKLNIPIDQLPPNIVQKITEQVGADADKDIAPYLTQ